MKKIAPKPPGRPRGPLKIKVMITLDPELKNWLDRYCQINGFTRSGYIEALIRETANHPKSR